VWVAWVWQELGVGLFVHFCGCAGINRHEVENERVLQERR
jgi:hypothetical protein